MPETSQKELDLLRKRADAVNHYVNRHRDYDPVRVGGDLYLQPKRKFRREHVDTVIAYATPSLIERELARIEGESYGS